LNEDWAFIFLDILLDIIYGKQEIIKPF